METNTTIKNLLSCTKYNAGFTPESVMTAYAQACKRSSYELKTKNETIYPNGVADLITCLAMYLVDECGGQVDDLFLAHLDSQLIYTWDLGQLAICGLMDGQFLQGSFYPEPEGYCEGLIEVVQEVATYLAPEKS